MKKAERATYIVERARKLARTGEHRNYLTIEWAIRSEGYHEARQVLDHAALRLELRRICERAQAESAEKNAV